ncbi:class I SAM-dependent methyltransferase [Actinoplanes sp. KI2]|uniref:class I SAM-dependent methyltransferase n=1 Tax=Actinoplanes sp. KI2 TaxID=2983315 RepID=UPI0021D5C0A1|nr:class I SAM-dependent methyltransferase [Actinoplanes sp. KI2]MCU7727716.1 class I SAM-dependent methyltransferase [Actinoplanes sp. KI2]
MALIAYDEADAAAFGATRHLGDEALRAWREAIAQHVDLGPGARLLDLGSGTGSWSRALRGWWPRAEVIGVEPSAAMRERAGQPPALPGSAEAIPLDDASVDAVWLSTVVHHIPDLAAAAREVRRVLRPGGPVLIRSAFAGRHAAITLFRYFPEAIAVLDRYPSVADVEGAFAAAGFATVALAPVPQVTASSLRDAVAGLRREAHTPLQLIDDDAYAAGLRRMRQAAESATGPVVDALDLLVLR